jgi:hypothetical protein
MFDGRIFMDIGNGFAYKSLVLDFKISSSIIINEYKFLSIIFVIISFAFDFISDFLLRDSWQGVDQHIDFLHLFCFDDGFE